MSSGGFLSSIFGTFRAQKLGFCALLPFRAALFRLSERKTTLFAHFWASRQHFSGLSSAKVGFLRAFGLPKRHFPAFRAQNCTFCALLAFPTVLFRPFERKTALFARFWPSRRHFSGQPSSKSHFLRASVGCLWVVVATRFCAELPLRGESC